MSIPTTYRGRLAVAAMILFIATVVVGALGPASSDEMRPLLRALGIISCNSSGPCEEGKNAGTGAGLAGTSVKGSGVIGQTSLRSTTSANGKAGVLGQDLSSSGFYDAGVRGVSTRGSGVIGQASNGTGVYGSSKSGFGVYGSSAGSSPVAGVWGTSTNAFGVEGFSSGNDGVFGDSTNSVGVHGQTANSSAASGAAGVEGIDDYGGSPDLNEGVFGSSTVNDGVVGETTNISPSEGSGVIGIDSGTNPNNLGVAGMTSTGTAVEAIANGDGGTGVAGIATTGEGLFVMNSGTNAPAADFFPFGSAGTAMIGLSNGIGVMAIGISNAGNLPAINAVCGNLGSPITATNPSIPKDVMSLDCSGNMILSGTLTQNGTPLALAHTSEGAQVTTYSAQQTMATLEDVGEAELTGGSAYVSVAPDFAAAIDQHANYLVFITPQGESQGLYVTHKTASGFEVRENGGGHATLAFDYRIVAKPYGRPSRRLPVTHIDMHTNPSVLAAIRQAVQGKARAGAMLAHARDQMQRVRLQAHEMDRNAKARRTLVLPNADNGRSRPLQQARGRNRSL
jgi:hypothetical protein